MKNLKCPMEVLLVICAAIFFFSTSAEAALDFVSGLQDTEQLTDITAAGNPGQIAVSLANGFPVWYEDANGLQLELCLDRGLELSDGTIVNPCGVAAPFAGAPVSFPGNFGAEALYWSAFTAGTFNSSDGSSSQALLVLAQEGGFANEGAPSDGNHVVFSRIRLRIDLPVAGTYRITHPFGSIDYLIDTPGVRAINQTQDLGVVEVQDFLVSMRDKAVTVTEPFVPGDPDAEDGVVNNTGATIGPFLIPTSTFNLATLVGGPVVVGNALYIGLPFGPTPLEVFQPVTGGINNFLRIELLNPPGGFSLDADNIDLDNNPNTVNFVDFQVMGKIFNDGLNFAPDAEIITVGAAAGQTVSINVFPGGIEPLDPIGATNVHGINPQAIAVADAISGGPVLNVNGMPILTAELPTTMGGTVRRVISIQSGQASFLYTPPPAVNGVPFTGIDTFNYVVQDTGGLISLPATVTVVVEDLQVRSADFRVRTGKYRVSGSSSNSEDNIVQLFAEPRTTLTPEAAGLLPPLVVNSHGLAALRLTDNAIQVLVSAELDSPATRITLHAGEPGQDGPVIFSLFESFFGFPFVSPLETTLDLFDLQTRSEQGISTFADALNAILAGNAYINVSTVASPGGEIRGQLLRPLIGSTPVVDGLWEFKGSATTWSGPLPGVSIESTNGVRTLGNTLRIR